VGAADGDLSFDAVDLELLELEPLDLELVEPDDADECPLPDVPPEEALTLPEDELPELDEALAWVEVIPGRPYAIPAAAMTLAAVADTAAALTRPRPRLLAATSPLLLSAPSPRGSCVLWLMTCRMANVHGDNRCATSEPAQNLGVQNLTTDGMAALAHCRCGDDTVGPLPLRGWSVGPAAVRQRRSTRPTAPLALRCCRISNVGGDVAVRGGGHGRAVQLVRGGGDGAELAR